MNIGFVIPSLTAGGAERVVTRLAGYLAEKGIRVIIFVHENGKVHYDPPASVEICRLRNLNAADLEKAVHKYQIDILSDHYHWNYDHVREAGMLAKRGIKVILSEHSSYFYPLFLYSQENQKEALTLYSQRDDLYKPFNAVTTLTRYSSQLLSSNLNNVVLMHNPLSYDEMTPSISQERRVLTVSSFLKPVKRIDLMLQAFSTLREKLPRAKLRVVGEIDYHRFIMFCHEIGMAENSVELTGITRNVQEHYLASSVFAMTSEIEGQSMALLEAACHALPQVVFRIPGIEDQIIDGETGYIIEPGNTDQFAETLNLLLRDDNLRSKIGNQARDFVSREFSLSKIGDRWMDLLYNINKNGVPTGDLRWGHSPNTSISVPTLLDDVNHWLVRAAAPVVQPRVSVIVPVFKTEELLRRCIDSLVSQTFRDIEIIVVSDGSPGNVKEIVAEYTTIDKRVRFIAHDKNRGLYQARSTGARVAVGSFLAHVDSDDYVHPDFIRRMYELAIVTGAEIVECRAVEISQDGHRRPFNSKYKDHLTQPDLLDAFINEKMRHVVWNKLYKKSLWDRSPLHMQFEGEITITEDLLRNAPIFLCASKYAFVDVPLYYYVRREQSVVMEGDFQKMLSKFNDINHVYEIVTKFFSEHKIEEKKVQKMLERQVTDIIWYLQNININKDEDIDVKMSNAADKFGIFAAVAVGQAKKNVELQRELNKTERGLTWERERANSMMKKLENLEE